MERSRGYCDIYPHSKWEVLLSSNYLLSELLIVVLEYYPSFKIITLGSHGEMVWHEGKRLIEFESRDLVRVVMYYSMDIFGNREDPYNTDLI